MVVRYQINNLVEYCLRIFFHLLYNQLAWFYDVVADTVSLGQWKDWISSISNDLDGPVILEIGHGPGHLITAVIERGLNIIGIDLSESMGKLAYRRIRDAGYEPSLTRGSAFYLPYKSASFNQLISTFPSEYILNKSTVDEAYRTLVPGGVFVILPVVWINGRKLLERFVGFIYSITGQSPEWDDSYTLPLTQAGFSIDCEERIVKSGRLLIIYAQKPNIENLTEK
jgi:ubiquinone/menaquinone biosynthesis C-methylase UbiE